jgi:ABC-type cobalt transport system substrate-binding protein
MKDTEFKKILIVIVLIVVLLLCLCVAFGLLVGGTDRIQEELATEVPVSTPTYPPTWTPAPTNTPECDPNYEPVCLQYTPGNKLDCKDIPERNFRVVGIDHHELDKDGDGIACEQ